MGNIGLDCFILSFNKVKPGVIVQRLKIYVILVISIILIQVFACNKSTEEGESAGISEGRDEYASSVEYEDEEETGLQLSKSETYNEVRGSVRLILAYDSESSSFIGTVENVTNKTVSGVRVEVHLSSGTELVPTTPLELTPGKKTNVSLSAEGHMFSCWQAHAETGKSESGHAEDHDEKEHEKR